MFTDSDDYPSFADVTGDFVYARADAHRRALARRLRARGASTPLAACARAWRDGERARRPAARRAGRPTAGPPRDVFLYFISGAKEKAPAAAMALLAALG